MLNRTQQPALKPVDHIEFVKPHIYDITSEVQLFFMQDVPNETARFDLYFDAGNIRHPKGIPSFVNGLLFSGNENKDSVQINEEIDALGGFMDCGLSSEDAVISMYSLRENMLPLMHVLADAINGVKFHESEVNELISDKKQKFQQNLEKVSFLAQRAFQEKLFHSSETYSKVVDESFYENISIQELKKFHHKHYLNGLRKVVVVGRMEQDEIDEIIDIVGAWAKQGKSEFESEIQNEAGQFDVVKKDAIQTAIRCGKILFNKTHEDYLDFVILNTILGDYFGSRLMSNIREDKGYTYGIGTMVAEYTNIGYLVIATEVGAEVKDATLKEIKYEIERLQTELVEPEELNLVVNYMRGQLLKSADGPYSMMDLYLGADIHGFDFEFYNQALHSLDNITSERIQQLAQKYLNWNELTVVTAGA
jgi:zinc protease